MDLESTQYHSLPFSARGQFSVQHFENKASKKKKMNVWWNIKGSCHRYLPGRIAMFLVRKDLTKKYSWAWPALAKQPINVVLVILKGLQYITR